MTDTIQVTGTYTVAQGDALTFVNQTGFELLGEHAKLVVAGSVKVTETIDSSTVFGVDAGDSTGSQVVIEKTGVFTVEATGAADRAFGPGGASLTNLGVINVSAPNLAFGASGTSVANAGTITATSPGEADGVGVSQNGEVNNSGGIKASGDFRAIGVSCAQGSSFTNTGWIQAIAAGVGLGNAAGVTLDADCTFDNSGHILASGYNGAVAVTLNYGPQSFVNSGMIQAVAIGDGEVSQGVFIDNKTKSLPLIELTNHGVIRADQAIFERSLLADTAQAISVTNSGKIFGDILLQAGEDDLTNSGKIFGDVDLGGGDDHFAGGRGKLDGVLFGGTGNDNLAGGKGADEIYGDGAMSQANDGADVLSGGKGGDLLHGGGGADTLAGGAGADSLDGGAGGDTFRFLLLSDSQAGRADLITRLDASDVIDLSKIDADTTHAGNQAFTLVGALDGHAGELVRSYDAGTGVTTISGDVDGDGEADLQILVTGNASGFTHFVL